MIKKEILDMFYNHIILEAFNGEVDCYFKYNILFNTRVPNKNIELVRDRDEYNDLMIPTLYIKDCDLFEQLLCEYVEKALIFYDNSNFCEEILKGEADGVSKEKVIMTLLWSNATIEDFQNPCLFLKRRINFFELGSFNKYLDSNIVGYSEVLGSDIECRIKKSKLENETPYYLQTFLVSSENNERMYEFPRIYFGISEDIANVYAIQNGKDRLINNKYIKKIERKMYKVNDGLDVKEDTLENYGVGNLKDITPSFLMVANILFGILKDEGIININVISILISRWNAKILTMDKKKIWLSKKGNSNEEIEQLMEEYYQKSIALQINLTDKFLRVFRRLGYHHSSIEVEGYPMEETSNLMLKMYDFEDVCNNRLLDETFRVGKNIGLQK